MKFQGPAAQERAALAAALAARRVRALAGWARRRSCARRSLLQRGLARLRQRTLARYLAAWLAATLRMRHLRLAEVPASFLSSDHASLM